MAPSPRRPLEPLTTYGDRGVKLEGERAARRARLHGRSIMVMGEGAVERLVEALERTAVEHHLAFRATDGEDPEWPSWYAARLKLKLPELAGFSEPELARLLRELEAAHGREGTNVPWVDFYAARLSRMAVEGDETGGV